MGNSTHQDTATVLLIASQLCIIHYYCLLFTVHADFQHWLTLVIQQSSQISVSNSPSRVLLLDFLQGIGLHPVGGSDPFMSGLLSLSELAVCSLISFQYKQSFRGPCQQIPSALPLLDSNLFPASHVFMSLPYNALNTHTNRIHI